MSEAQFLVQSFFVVAGVCASAWIGLSRFRWTRGIAWIYSVAALGGYASLSYLLREQTWILAYALPTGVAIVAVVCTMLLSEQFWRRYRHIETQLVQSEKMAALGNLVAGIAHEINTPVGAIRSSRDTLNRALDKLMESLQSQASYQENRGLNNALKVIEDASRVIETGSDRVARIVRSLRSFARLDEGEMMEADIHEGLEDTLMLINHDLENRVDVTRNFGDVPSIICYPSRLNQVFLNILVNAVQAIEDTGEITISTFQKGDQVHVAIKDNGVGISDEALEKVFEPGFTTRGGRIGMGLGLSICYQIVQDHAGEIQVESKIGEGSTFTVILPRGQ